MRMRSIDYWHLLESSQITLAAHIADFDVDGTGRKRESWTRAGRIGDATNWGICHNRIRTGGSNTASTIARQRLDSYCVTCASALVVDQLVDCVD